MDVRRPALGNTREKTTRIYCLPKLASLAQHALYVRAVASAPFGPHAAPVVCVPRQRHDGKVHV
jgi:hypothetical protein